MTDSAPVGGVLPSNPEPRIAEIKELHERWGELEWTDTDGAILQQSTLWHELGQILSGPVLPSNDNSPTGVPEFLLPYIDKSVIGCTCMAIGPCAIHGDDPLAGRSNDDPTDAVAEALGIDPNDPEVLRALVDAERRHSSRLAARLEAVTTEREAVDAQFNDAVSDWNREHDARMAAEAETLRLTTELAASNEEWTKHAAELYQTGLQWMRDAQSARAETLRLRTALEKIRDTAFLGSSDLALGIHTAVAAVLGGTDG